MLGVEQQHSQSSTASRAARVRRLIVSVADIDASLRLYAGALDLELAWRQGELAQLVTAEQIEVLLHQRVPQPTDVAVAIGFQIEGLDRVVRAWIDLGGTVIDAPAVQPWGEVMATLRDVDGHVVCVSDLVPAQHAAP